MTAWPEATALWLSGAALALLVSWLAGGLAQRGWLPVAWVLHPWCSAQATSVTVGVTMLYSMVMLPFNTNVLMLLGAIGLVTLFLLAPSMLNPLLRLVRHHHLDSLAALLEFRYHSLWVGRLSALILCAVGVLVMAVGLLMLHWLLGGVLSLTLGLYAFMGTVVLAALASLGGLRTAHSPAVLMMVAVSALLKLLGLVVLAWVLGRQAFGDLDALTTWVDAHPLLVQQFMSPLHTGLWQPLMLFSGLITLMVPHIFQMVLIETHHPGQWRQHRWMVLWSTLPVLLLTPLLYLSLRRLGEDSAAPLGLPLLQQPVVALCVGLVVVAALTGTLLMTLLPLQRMLWRYGRLAGGSSTPSRLQSLLLHAVLLGLVVLVFLAIRQASVVSMFVVMLSGLLVLLPLLGGLLLWPRLNRHGALMALGTGGLGWLGLVALPHFLLNHAQPQILWPWLDRFDPLLLPLLNLLAGCVVLALGSQLYPQRHREYSHALECVLHDPEASQRYPLWQMVARSPQEMQRLLSRVLGRTEARQQLDQARRQLILQGHAAIVSQDLEALRLQLIQQLARVRGLGAAQALIEQALPYQARFVLAVPVTHFESPAPLADFPLLPGSSTALDSLRRLHRQVLLDLPIGVCSVDPEQRITGWNRQMATLTGLGDEVVGWRLHELGRPWGELLQRFLSLPVAHLTRQPVQRGQVRLLINLHRADLKDQALPYQVIVVENVTQTAALEDQVAHQDRLAAIGRLVAGVAHEIGNPVAGIHVVAQNLQMDFDDPEIQAAAGQIVAQTERIRDIVSALVGYARTDPQDHSSWQTLSLLALLEDAIRLTQMGKRCPLNVSMQVDPQLHILCYPPQMRQVLINLFSNAIDATPYPKKGVRLHISTQETGSHVLLEIEDFGQGLPDGELRDRLFEPFITTKPQGVGTGLGLSVVQGIVRSHGGKIQLIDKRDYDQGHGVIVQLTLPMAEHSSVEG